MNPSPDINQAYFYVTLGENHREFSNSSNFVPDNVAMNVRINSLQNTSSGVNAKYIKK